MGTILLNNPDPEYFWLIFMATLIISVPNVLEWTAPTLLSSLWFPSNERAFSTATTAAIAPQVRNAHTWCGKEKREEE